MGINVLERTREIGILRAIGATPKWIVHLFVMEGFVVATMSIVLGVLCAIPMSSLAADFFGQLILGDDTQFDFAFSVIGFIITLAVTLIFGYIASKVPAKAATRPTVRKALAYE